MEDFKHNEILDSGLVENSSPWEGIEYAGFWQRVLATLLDTVIIIICVFISILIFVALIDHFNFGLLFSSSFIFIAYLLIPVYKIVMEGTYGATLGKMVLRLKIVDKEAQVINMGLALRRYVLYGISFIVAILSFIAIFKGSTGLLTISSQVNGISSIAIFISCLFVAFDDRKQSLHDKIADTYVVQNNGESYGGGFN